MEDLGLIVYIGITLVLIMAGAYKNKSIGILGGFLLTAFPFLFIDTLGLEMLVTAVISLAGIAVIGAFLQEGGYL